MPIYEYECEGCKKRFEVLQKMSDPPLATCSACSGNLHKLVSSPAGLLFKGSGWYVTDYARKNGKSADTKTTDDTKPAASGESTKKDPPKAASPESTPSSKDN